MGKYTFRRHAQPRTVLVNVQSGTIIGSAITSLIAECDVENFLL